MKYSWFFLILFCLFSCNSDSSLDPKSDKLFDALNSNYTGILFNNALTFTEEYNPYTFKNFFNGGGVGLGDFNNDGWVDIYLTGNLVDNKLYLNKGNFQFEDITNSSGTACTDVWSSGVSLVDINSDGLLDIYVCKSGEPNPKGNRKNELLINQGDLTFVDKANEYGLDFEGLAVHAVFFDYDLDGDLDCYLLNNSIRSVGGYDIIEGQRNIPNPEGGNKLLKSLQAELDGKNIRYVDVTQEAGIYSSSIGFGLGVSVSDLNNDGWPDIFVSNDFFEKDYLYINNQDGTFSETVDASMQELSMGSMGADIADIDNDGNQDIFVTEMLPSNLERIKSKAVFENFEKSQLNTEKGYHRQFGRNALHIHAGKINNNVPVYQELSRYSGTAATEWSWGALIEDFDQDGLKDIFVANGIYKDLLDQDYLNFFSPSQIRKLIQTGEQNAITKMFETMPSSPYPNVFFKNEGELRFSDISIEAGFDKPTYSNGSAYADLDNDGDLDIVTNDIGKAASVYRNNSDNDVVSLYLKGGDYNSQAIGSKIVSYIGKQQLVKELYPMKGFESTVDSRVIIPAKPNEIDSLKIIWPNQTISTVDVKFLGVDTVNTLNQNEKKLDNLAESTVSGNPLLTKVEGIISYTHAPKKHIDINKNRTQPFFVSNTGPVMAVADIDTDGKEDLIIGGNRNQSAQAFIQQKGKLKASSSNASFNTNGKHTDILVFDANHDGQKDLYFASGGIEFGQASSGLKDELLINKNRQYTKADNSFFNASLSSSSSVVAIDYDSDGDQDIIASERLKPIAYGIKGNLNVYQNAKGAYRRTVPLKSFQNIGLITEMKSADLNANGNIDLVIACEYDNFKLLSIGKDKEWIDVTSEAGLNQWKGRWNTFEIADIDNDGDLDIIAANMGTNNRISNLMDSTARWYINDFDRNGTIEGIFCVGNEEESFPTTLRDDLLMQVPSLKKKVLSYEVYSKASMQMLFDSTILNESLVYEINELRTGIFINNNGKFDFQPLPKEAQWTEQYAIFTTDLNGDGRKDIILGGNQYKAKSELGISAASFGQVFLQNSDGTFLYLPFEKSGMYETGEIRSLETISIGSDTYLLVGKNNNKLTTYLLPKK